MLEPVQQDIPGYRIQKTHFISGRTSVQQGVRIADSLPVILKRIRYQSPNERQLQRFSFSYEVLMGFNHPNISTALDFL